MNRHENRSANSQRVESPTKTVVFATTGDYWTIGEPGATFSIRASKGLAYIYRLLQHPGEEFHALDLVSGPDTAIAPEGSYLETASTDSNLSVGRLGDAGEMLDGKAKQDYKRRLVELREQLEDSQALGNSERAAEIESEIDFLAREISRAIGLSGRDRRAGSVAERARLNVSRAITAALHKISEHDSGLGGMLDRSVRTGSFCSYVADLQAPTVWQFSTNSLEPAAASDSTAPVLPSNEFAFAQAVIGRTTFVGREAESAVLDRVLDYARSGKGRVVMISGPPGVGKTRIATEFCAKVVRNGLIAISGNCYDREEPEPFLPFVEILETSLAHATSPKAFLNSLGSDAPEISRLLPQLRRMFPEIPPLSEVAPEQSRRILLTAITNVITRAAQNIPVVVLLEDLHWADESTLSALTHLARSLSQVPLLVVGTYRDNEFNEASPLAQAVDELNRLHLVDRLSLSGLSIDAVASMLRDLSGSDPSPTVVEFIYSSTEGNPFFVEEVFRHLIERGELIESAEFRRDRSLSDIDVPPNVRLAIGRRLAKLSDSTQRALGTAALIGRSFNFGLLEAATGLDPDSLLDQVEEAEKAGLILSALDYPEARFQFSHELVRQAVIADLSPPRRQRLHLGIANAIESIHSAALDNHASDLAHHLWQAGTAADANRTLRFLAIAGRLAIEQSAYKSALFYLNNALELIPKLPDSQERARTELGIQIDYGLAMLAMKGWSASEYGDAYKRARELCRGLGGDDPRLFSVLSGLANFHVYIPKLQAARSYGNEMMQLARTARNDEMLVQAYWVWGYSQFFMADFIGAHGNFELSFQHYDPQKHHTLAFQSGNEPGVLSLIYDAMTLWILGYADQAEKKAQESLLLARELRSPFTLVVCLCMMAKYASMRWDFLRAAAFIEEGLALANEREFGFYKEGLIAYQTIGLAALGRIDELKVVSRRHRKLSEVGYELAQTWARSYLAEGLGKHGRIDTALALIAQAEALMERNEERYVEAEIHRIKGEVTLKQASGGGISPAEIKSMESSAEQNFRTAIRVARLQSAKSFELRASLSLSRLLMRDNRQAEAQQVLSETYALFIEGFDMPELKAAKALLDELGSP